MIVPIVTAAAIRTACTIRKEVGLDPPMSPDQARWSFQIAIAKRGQMTQLKAPASTRKTDQLRERITSSLSRHAADLLSDHVVGAPNCSVRVMLVDRRKPREEHSSRSSREEAT